MKNLFAFVSRFSFINIRVTSVFLVIVLLAIGAEAQSRRLNDGSTPSGIEPGSPAGSFSLSNLDTINPYNGNLSFQLPLINIGGRGSSGYTVTLPINYRWTVFHRFDQPGQFFQHHPSPYRDLHAIRPNYRAGKFEVRNVREDSWCGPGEPQVFSTLRVITFTSASGSEYEFRSEAFNGSPGVGYCNSTTGTSRGTVWKTSDGSFLTFISDTAMHDLDGVTSSIFLYGYLIFPDGTKYRIEAGEVSWIRDRNGNVTTFTYSNARLAKVTDSIGREITFTYDLQDSGQYGLHDQITYKGFGGQTRTIRILYKSLAEVLRSDQTIQTYQSLFAELDSSSSLHNPTDHIAAVWLPNGQNYRFYYNSYSELARVELPTGGAFEYDWGASLSGGSLNGVISVNYLGDYQPEIYRQVLTKRIYPEGGTGSAFALKTTFSQTQGQGTTTSSRTIEQRDAGNILLGQTKHYFHGNPIPSQGTNINFKPAWDEGKEYQTEIFDIVSGNSVLKQRVNQTWQKGAGTGYNEGNARVIETTISLVDTNQVAKTTAVSPIDGSIGFDLFNNPTDVWEYDYGTGAPGQFLLRTHTDYVTDSNYTSYTGANLLGLPLQTWVSSDAAGNNKASLTQFEYDNYAASGNYAPLVNRSNVIGHDTANYDANNTRRGNAIRTTSYGNAQNQTDAVSVYSQFDILGNVVKTIDAKGNASTIGYNDNFGSPDGEATTNSHPSQLNGQSTFAFATSATNPLNWTAYTQFDYFTGAIINTQDVNGVISKTLYNDLLDRPTQSFAAVGTPNEVQSKIVYDDANRRIETTSDLNALNDNLIKAESYYDGLGRTFETRSYRDGDYVSVKTEYDALGRVKRASNPYRPARGETAVWTTSAYDALSRLTSITTPDGAIATTAYSGNATTATDQAEKQRRSISNALGQLIRVDEPDNAGNLGTVSSPMQPTSYNYDALGNMVRVTQGVQSRYFKYDSLGRLLRVRQPEQGTNPNLALADAATGNSDWSAGFTYDDNGNLLTTRDTKNTVITSAYDALNRVLSRSYSDATPQVTYTYDDSTIQFSKGKLTKISNSVSTSQILSLDNLGRVLSSRQTTDGQNYDSAYIYNLSGGLVEETYPSGRKVKNTFEADGDLSKVETKTAFASYQIRADNFTYAPHGAIERLQIGNGRWENAQFNSRLQVTQLGLGTSATDTSLWKLDYTFGTTDNNGNVQSQTTTVPGLGSLLQVYRYDSLNRLKSVRETKGLIQTFKQTYLYDRYGNRNFDEANTTTLGNCSPEQCNPTVDVNTNRFTTGQGYTYDLAGNIITDAEGRQFIFNGDNKQTQVKDANNNVIGTYYYDGDGKRIKKVTNLENTTFVYSGGKLVAEYSTQTPPASPVTQYLMTDMLGSPRVITDQNGNVTTRRDFMPFGEDLYGIGGRDESVGYTADSIRQKFTGYQKDDETGLDFAEARYYNNQNGRFTAVDPLLASGKSANPQTFNRYSYTMNNPLVLTDPSGMQAGRWMYPQGGGKSAYVRWNAMIPRDENDNEYVPVIRRNRNNDLVAEGADLPEHLEIRFNPMGPLSELEKLDAIATGRPVSYFEENGWDLVQTDESYKAFMRTGAVFNAIEPVDIALLATPLKFGTTSFRTVEGSLPATRPGLTSITSVSTLEVGPFAVESIPARSTSQVFTATERSQMNSIGNRFGCHTCGNTTPGTKSGNWILDHQPVSNLVPPGTPQRLFPHCIRCSNAQGGIVRWSNIFRRQLDDK